MSYNSLFGLGSHSQDANLEGHWRLQDDAASTTIVDSSGNGRTGTNNANTSTKSTTGPNGWLSKALSFDGSSDRISLPATAFVSGAAARSFILWFKADAFDTGTLYAIADLGGSDGAQSGKGLVPYCEDNAVSVAGFGHRTITPKSTLSTGTWYSFGLKVPVGATTTGNIELLLNGVNQSQTTEAGSSQTLDTLLQTNQWLGFSSNLSRYYDGNLAGVSSFSRALTDAEFLEAYRGPEPLISAAGSIQVQGGGDPTVGSILEVNAAATYSHPVSGANGAITITYRWFVNDVYQSTGSTFDTTGLSVDDDIKFQSRGTNNGDYDPAEDTDSSNTITLVSSGPTYTLSCTNGSFTLTGQSTGLVCSRNIAATQGTFTLSGQAVSLTAARKIAAGQGSFALTGQDVDLVTSSSLSAEHGSFSLTGQSVALTTARKLLCSAGAFTLTGQAVGLSRGRVLPAGQVSFTLSGQAVSLTAARKIVAAQGSLSLTGQDVTLTYTPIGGPDYTLTCAAGSFALSGQAVGLVAARKLTFVSGSFTLDGQAVTLSAGRNVAAGNGSFILTWQDAGLFAARKIAPEYGAISLTGQDVTLAYSGGNSSGAAFYYYLCLGV